LLITKTTEEGKVEKPTSHHLVLIEKEVLEQTVREFSEQYHADITTTANAEFDALFSLLTLPVTHMIFT